MARFVLCRIRARTRLPSSFACRRKNLRSSFSFSSLRARFPANNLAGNGAGNHHIPQHAKRECPPPIATPSHLVAPREPSTPFIPPTPPTLLLQPPPRRSSPCRHHSSPRSRSPMERGAPCTSACRTHVTCRFGFGSTCPPWLHGPC